MDPTDEQIDGFNTVLSIAQWVELPGDPGEANSAMARLFALLGTNGTQHPRVLGCMPETDYTALLEEWTFGEPEAPPYAGQQGPSGVNWACRSHKVRY